MQVKKSTYADCQALTLALKSKSDEAIIETVERLGLEKISDPDLMTLARASSSNSLVVLLSTLLKENGIEPQKSSLILAAYTSIIKKETDPLILNLGGRNPISWVIKGLIENKAEIKPFRKKINITPEILLAIEIAIDFKAPKLALNLIRSFVSSSPNLLEFQTVLNSLALRNDLQPETFPWGDIADCWIELLSNFKKYDDDNASQHIKMFIANALSSTERVDECLSYCDEITEKEFLKPAIFLSVQTLCKNGRIKEAINRLKNLVENHKFDKLYDDALNLKLDAEAESKKYQTEFDIDSAKIALQDLYKILDPVGIKPFLVSGTLLGYSRNNNFMAHDKDIDVGVFASVDKFTIFEEILKSGKFMIDWQSLIKEPLYTIAVTHISKSITIDIFFYHDNENSLITGVNYDWKFERCFKFSKFGLQKVNFSGIDAYVPDNIELNLFENFGPNWNKEDKNYISHLESPSGQENDGEIYMLLLWIHLVLAINKGNKEKIKKVWEISKLKSDNPLAPTNEFFEGFLNTRKIDNQLIAETRKEFSYAV
jgi:hypothetical protein